MANLAPLSFLIKPLRLQDGLPGDDPGPDRFAARGHDHGNADLAAQGVRFSQPPVKMGFGWWALFEDCDGTRYALGQW